jgi:hypothetical protein
VITQAYGLGFFIEKLDYRFNPKKGIWSKCIQGAVGSRQIRKNPKINDLAYSTISLKSSQYQFEGEISLVILILTKNHVLN